MSAHDGISHEDLASLGADISSLGGSIEHGLTEVAEALGHNLTSPCVSDSELGPANVVDVLHDIARAGFSISRSIRLLAMAVSAPHRIHWDDDGNQLDG